MGTDSHWLMRGETGDKWATRSDTVGEMCCTDTNDLYLKHSSSQIFAHINAVGYPTSTCTWSLDSNRDR